MKKLFLLLFLPSIFFAQELTMDEDVNMYSYSHIKYLDTEPKARLDQFESKLKELNYQNIVKDDSSIKAESFITKMIFGSAMEVHYNVIVDFKEGRYRLLINSFTINDVRYGAVALETLKRGAQKRWVKFINSELPQIVKNVESTSGW